MTTPSVPPPVHLSTKVACPRARAGGRAFPLNEKDMPFVTALDVAGRVRQLLAARDWLDPEHMGRYLKYWNEKLGRYSTCCNTFAHDFAYLAKVFFPRVWWNSKALAEIARIGIAPTPTTRKGAETVGEMSANALAEWMPEWGPRYGWQAAGPELAQKVVNEGGFGVALAKAGIGHVSVIIPETETEKALRSPAGVVLAPAQCQAGAKNLRYFATRWWNKGGHRGGLWVVPWVDPATLLTDAAKRAANLIKF